MDDPRTGQPNDDGEIPRTTEASKEIDNDPEAIANRVVDVFWESFHAGKDGDS